MNDEPVWTLHMCLFKVFVNLIRVALSFATFGLKPVSIPVFVGLKPVSFRFLFSIFNRKPFSFRFFLRSETGFFPVFVNLNKKICLVSFN